MHSKDIYQQVAQIHIENINQGFLSTLGEGFLTLMYQAIDESPSSTLIVEKYDEKVVGFVAGGSSFNHIYREMFRHLPRLLYTLSPAFLRPSTILKIFKIVSYTNAEKPLGTLSHYELYSIAVKKKSRGKGVAKKLYTGLKHYFDDIEASEFKIVVGKSLTDANMFYIKMGAEPQKEISIHEGAKSIVYRQVLTS
jgi:ribosomal protein S18 acetylase RimI-like enzyme